MGGTSFPNKTGEHFAKSITIGKIYRLPMELVGYNTEFINEFTPVLVGLEKSKNEVIITGDFNTDIQILKINEKYTISEYFDMFTTGFLG